MDLLDEYFKTNRYFVTNHHLESYNEFTSTTIKKVIQSMNPLKVIKTDDGILKHEINLYIGGTETEELYFTKCKIADKSVAHGTRLLYPNECRMKNMSYVCELRANVLVEYIEYNKSGSVSGKRTKELKDILLSKIPIMLHSDLCMLNNQPTSILKAAGECQYDQGGYFIIDGKEKVIVAQERNVTNRLYISALPEDDKKYTHQAFIRCTSEKNSVFPKTFWIYIKKSGAIVIKVPHIDLHVPLFVMFRALGIESDHDIIKHICGPDESDERLVELLRLSVLEAAKAHIMSQSEALNYLSTGTSFKNVDNVMYIIFEDFFPNVPDTMADKARVLGLLARQTAEVCLGYRPESDRDNYMQKRVGISGFLIGDIFKDFYNDFRVETRKKVDNMYVVGFNHNTLDELSEMITEFNANEVFSKSEKLQVGLIKSLKGNWGMAFDSTLQGIVQDLNRLSYVGFISHMRRVCTPMSETALKIRAPHQLGTSQWGYMCPCESPDGASIGLLKNMAILCHVTFGIDPQVILDALKAAKLDVIMLPDVTFELEKQGVRLHINNNWIGVVMDPVRVTKYIRLLRQTNHINPMISVSWNVLENQINILTDSGRCTRPLLLCSSPKFTNKNKTNVYADVFKFQQKMMMDFKSPFTKSVDTLDQVIKTLEQSTSLIDYVDVEESNTSMIAMSVDVTNDRHTHCEIHPSTIFSVYSSTIPLANHNCAPRNIFSGAHGKQAIGVYATNYNNRLDTMSLILHYPQRALVSTRYMDYLNVNKLPNGENLIVAIATYTGYNQEDSIIINADSAARGMFNLTYYASHVASESISNDGVTEILFGNPNNAVLENKDVKISRFANYTKIDDQGLPKLNEYVEDGDCILGKILKTTETVAIGDVANDIFIQTKSRTTYKSVSDIADKTIRGHIDKIALFDLDGTSIRGAKIRIREVREPELGDKMASRHGQKGVIGSMMPASMLPFTKDGLVPDIIVNPHAFPSRMTIAHLLECIMAKAGVSAGFYANGTTFENQDVDSFSSILAGMGLNGRGDEIMYNGITGEQMKCEIFIGPTYYFRLKHMVADKINYRDNGQMVGMTQQPTKGRGNGGGLRIGEMETNVLLSHGISSFTKESMMERSDKYTADVDKDGFIGPVSNHVKHIGDLGDKKIEIPFAFKLMSQELAGMSVVPLVRFDKFDDVDAYDALLDSECASDEEDEDEDEQEDD